MDVSFTNVLEGARQYFQGLPVPSTGGGAATSVDHNLHSTSSTNPASSTSATTHDHDAPSQPTQSTQSISTSANSSSSNSSSNAQESNRYSADVRPSSSMESSNAAAGSSFWNPHVEPYAPQPTRVEVPDTRPGDEGSAMEPSSSSSGTVTLTEMQPSNYQSSSSSSVAASSSNFSQRPPPTSSSSSSSTTSSSSDHNHHHQSHLSASSSSSHLHQMQPPQPPHSPGPVYQQLNNVSRTSFSAAEMLASSSSHSASTYQTANNDRQSQPIVAQRTQYYPRYHHPDITKCAPAPYSQNSIYQSANVAQSSSMVQQPSTRPTPVEQNNTSSNVVTQGGHCPPEQQRIPGTYGGNMSLVQSPVGGSTVYGSGSSSSSSQSYRSASQYQQQTHRLTASASSDRSHSSNGLHSSTAACSSSSQAVSPRQPGPGSSSNHIPSQSQSQNVPGHIPSPHLPSAATSVHYHQHQQQQQQQQQQHHQQLSPLQQQQQQQQHPSRINASPHSHSSSYGGRVMPLPPHGVPSSSSSVAMVANHSQQQQMPPPPSGYHAGTTPSPHHEPSPRHATPSPHHATPSPQRQSPHVSSLHNPHASPSPHHTPSPHNSFQPHSPTYPPPPPPPLPQQQQQQQQQPSASSRSTPHSYNLSPATSQHYQTNYVAAVRDAAMGLPYAPPPPSQSSYHSFQKSSQSESQGSSYYSQPNRSHNQSYGMQQMLVPPQTVYPTSIPGSNSLGSYQQNAGKHPTYNGADATKKGVIDVTTTPYGTHRSPAQRSGNTHNLPPIAALSSYHSNRREPLGKSAQITARQRMHSTNATSKVSPVAMPPSSITMPPQRLAEYPMTPVSAMNHAIPVNGRTTTVTNMTYGPRYSGQQNYPSSSYATTIAPSHHGNNSTNSTTVTTISHGGSSGARSSVPTVHVYQSSDESDRTAESSSYHHHHQPPTRITESYAYKEYPYQNPASSGGNQATSATTMTSSPSSSNAVRKRESPLDLSVKTVKTSADSTAQDDLETGNDKHVSSSSLNSSRNNVNRPMPPPSVVHQSSPAQPSYSSSYDHRPSSNSSRNSMPVTCVRASTPQTVCAPKVDFLPDFTSAPLRHQSHHENPLRRSTMQQLYVPSAQPLSSHHTNTSPLPHMSTFKKRPLPTSPLYDSLTIPPPPSSSSSTSASSSYLQTNDSVSSRFSKYHSMMDPSPRLGPPTLPAQDYPPDSSKYHLADSRTKFDQQFPQRERIPYKRAGEAIYGIGSPSKQARVAWRAPSTEKQIVESKLSTTGLLNEQQKRQEMNLSVPLPNGALTTPSVHDQRTDGGYSAPESRYQSVYCDKRTYPESKVVRSSPSSYNHPVISKSASIHPLPQQLSSAQLTYPSYRQSIQKTACPPSGISGGQPIDQPSNTGADKRVLSLLRNSLENKQQRDEQLNSQQPIFNHSQQSFQNKVVAPVEPKSIGRHNLSPFTAASLLERNSNTPPHYKFHVPRAVDSITQEVPRSMYASRVNASATLPGKEASLAGPRSAENQIHRDKDDGLAAILAAKIRTKAELKQVGTGQFTMKASSVPLQDVSSTPREIDSAASTSTPQSGSSAGSPPKLTREKTVCVPPRRRLFSRTDEDIVPVAAIVPVAVTVASTVPARASGCRSSSETSVFDFRESDSEGEMPVLERQTLEEMRRDRKQLSKVQPPIPLNDAVCMNMASSTDLVKIELKENDKINDIDPFWSNTCDKFMEQLRTGDVTKKRGRRKKVGATPKLEDTANDSDKESDTNASHSRIKPEDIKKEIPDPSSKDDKNSVFKDIKIKTEPGLGKEDDKHSSDDSDEVPLIKRTRQEVKKEDSDCDEEVICRRRRIRRGGRIKLESSSGSESSSEDSDASTEFGHGSSVADRLRARKRSIVNVSEGMKLRSRDTTPHKTKMDKESKLSPPKGGTSQKGKPKPLFGDGSDFRPGWEEEVYVYKKSLRMPPRLITVSKPSRFHRLSTSLPDLDPGSPALSVSMDSSDVCLSRNKRDSDMESNYSFSIMGLGSKIDDEEATSSTTVSCPPKAMMKHFRSENNSIVDVLAQKVGSGQKDSKKKQNLKTNKNSNVNKSNNEPELLPTPGLTPLLSSETSKSPRNKIVLKNNRNPIKVSNSVLLGYFRKETVNNFRDAFKNNHTLPNEFSTLVLKSRTRTETKVLKKETTIREVFGEDRPASAPPMQNHDDTSQDDDSQNETPENALGKVRTLKQKVVSRLRNAGILRSHKAIVNSKRRLLTAERRKDLLKSLANKKLHRIKIEQEETNDVREEENNEMEDDKNDLEIRNKKKLKLRPGRRKFRSGFDYIRKKKKPLKKDEALSKERKRQSQGNKPSPECVADIQSEIRTWVIKKGVGETILHRAARLGYTDVTAYCLEKLNSAPSPKDNAGYTPLHEACSKGHLEIAKLLLAYGANVSESANGGIRPLHEAAENGATELVRLLLSYGADPLLATYSGQTPLMLAVDTEANSILEQHLADIQGCTTVPWSFAGPSSILDPEETGYNPLDDVPLDNPESLELDDIEMEVSDINLPVLFTLNNDPDKWVLLQDLMAILRIKSRDALLRQINPKAHSGPPAIAHRDVMRELKLPDFLEQTRCCHLLSGGERINVRGSKVTLIKYNDKVKSLLNVEKVLISVR